MFKFVMMPLRSVVSLAENIRDEIDKEMFSVTHIQQQLILLYTRYETNELEEGSFQEQEAELLGRLLIAKQREWEQLSAADEDEDDEDEDEDEDDDDDAEDAEDEDAL